MLRSWGGLTRHVTWAVSYPSGLQLPHLQRGGGGTALMLPALPRLGDTPSGAPACRGCPLLPWKRCLARMEPGCSSHPPPMGRCLKRPQGRGLPARPAQVPAREAGSQAFRLWAPQKGARRGSAGGSPGTPVSPHSSELGENGASRRWWGEAGALSVKGLAELSHYQPGAPSH